MYCSKCGKEIPPQSNFCLFCGTRVAATPEPPANPSKHDFHIPYIENEHGKFTVRDTETGKSKDLQAEEALELLEYCQNNEDWKTNGIPITDLVYHFNLPNRAKKGKSDSEKDLEIEEKHEPVRVERFRVTGNEAEMLFKTLTKNEEYLKKKRDSERKHTYEVIRHCQQKYFGWLQKAIAEKIDLSVRTIGWTKENETTYRGEHNSFIGEASLHESSFFWFAAVKSPQRKYYKVERCATLSNALDWMEKTIEAAKDEPVVEPEPAEELPPPFELTDAYREKLAEYWIDPASLEPEVVTYEPVIDLVHKPDSFKTFTLFTGEQIQIDEIYPPTATLAVRAGLDSAGLDCQELVDGWYRITGLTHYYQAQEAITSAQSVWEKSKILELFKQGSILKARYGYRETETGYTEYIGECTQDGKTWHYHTNRDEYLKERALRYTLIYALDVSGYRSLLQLSLDITDERLLHDLHKFRAECKYISPNACADSLKWLREKELADRITHNSQSRSKKKKLN